LGFSRTKRRMRAIVRGSDVSMCNGVPTILPGVSLPKERALRSLKSLTLARPLDCHQPVIRK
jgi:hypothetical protein